MDDDVTINDLRLVTREPIAREDYVLHVACLPDWVLDEAGLTWAQDGRILAVTDERDTFYPRFQFDDALQPKPAMAEVLAGLPPSMDAWARALWLANPNPRLGGDRPMDRLDQPAALLAAAGDLEERRLAA